MRPTTLASLYLVCCYIKIAAFVIPKQATSRQTTIQYAVPVDLMSYKPSLKLDEQEPFDTIIIGSGIGGLSCASVLAQSKEKQRVLVLEQHYKCGGCCHTFTKKNYKFSTGIHYVGEVGDKTGTGGGTGLRLSELLDAITPADTKIPWTPMDKNYDTIIIGKSKEDSRRFKIYSKEHKEQLKEQFPSHEDQVAIDKYFSLCQKATKSLKRAVAFKMLPRKLVTILRKTFLLRILDKGYHKFATVTVRDVVDSLTDNKELRTVLEYNWGDYGSLPSVTPFLMHSLLYAHYGEGAYYPETGSDVIPQSVIPTITANGGMVLANAPVRQIITESTKKGKTKATGVELFDGTKLYAKRAVVSDAGVSNTIQRLVPPCKERDAMINRLSIAQPTERDEVTTVGNGNTGLCLFVGLKGDHDIDFKLPHTQIWMYPSSSIEDDMNKLPRSLEEALQTVQPHNLTPLFVGSPSSKDGAWRKKHPGKAALEIITGIPWEWFEKFAPSKLESNEDRGAFDLGGKSGVRDAEYENAKAKIAEIMWARARQGLIDSDASETLPKTLAGVDVFELGTPLTYAHYLWNEKGSFYGLAHDIERFSPRIFFEGLRPECEIESLFLSGQDISISSLAGALSGGFLCAAKILGKLDPFSLLKEVEHNRVIAAVPEDTSNSQSSVDQVLVV